MTHETRTAASAMPWREAWRAALYGPHGFYRREEGPAGHFTTSTHGPLGVVFAEGIAALADREGCTSVVDIGAGRGELLSALAAIRPDLALTGVDVVPRPADLPERIGWLVSPGGAALPDALRDLRDTLVVAHEWLDVVPCTVTEVDADGDLREVLVDEHGVESLGDPLTSADRAWADRWWPVDPGDVGARVEVGRSRDDAWADLLTRVESGTVLAVDYGHTRGNRPRSGSLQAYAAGALTAPVPDGSCDLTAHVATDSLVGHERLTQREALADVGLVATQPPVALASADPAAYLQALARAGAVGALRQRGALGDFHWVLSRVVR